MIPVDVQQHCCQLQLCFFHPYRIEIRQPQDLPVRLGLCTRASSIIYSLVETAKLNNLNIYAYLETVLLYMPDYKNEPEGIEELMPWSDMY